MTAIQQVEQQAYELLAARGINGHISAKRFVQDFVAYLIYFDAVGVGNAADTLTLLRDHKNLIDSAVLKTNFKKSLSALMSPSLKNDPIFPRLFEVLLGNKGKGVGIGELALPLIFAGYSFSNDSDGRLLSGAKVEVKANGASLKPVKTGVTEKGLVDRLNKKYFQGTVPGKKLARFFDAHVKTVVDPAVYGDYFAELYPGCDISDLVAEVICNYRDAKKFNNAVGRFALKQYQKVDGWQNIMFIDAEEQMVVNIADPNEIESLGLSFSPIMSRNKDTQAICDGYVNVSF